MSNILVDDADTPILAYTGSWTPSGNANEYNSTTHGSSSAGASVSLTFHGTSIQVYGTIGPSAGDGVPQTSYFLDNNPEVIYIAANNPGNALYHQPFFTSPPIPDGEHNLTITIRPNSGFYWLDYFVFAQNTTSSHGLFSMPNAAFSFTSALTPDVTSDAPTLTFATSVPSQPSFATSVPSQSSFATSVPSQSSSDVPSFGVTSFGAPTTIPAETSSSSTTTLATTESAATPASFIPDNNNGAGSLLRQPASIAGIIIGILGVLAAMAFGIYICVRRHRENEALRIDTYLEVPRDCSPLPHSPHLRPLTLPMAHRAHMSYTSTVPSNRASLGARISALFSSSPLRNEISPAPMGCAPHMARYGDGGLRDFPFLYPRQSLDGGIRISGGPPDLQDVPPAYSYYR
ncbi:hypothetical protein BDW22DRAFT_586348 [Trametopsis cervina]|nr:hypothetical protein BDW22DRAFT_586348 [Trametopsis cervina]